jgi:hypothetical protein
MRMLLVVLAVAAGCVIAPAADAAALLTATRTGGIAGVQDRVDLRVDGTGVRTDRAHERVALRAGETRGARSALAHARFGSLRTRYTPPDGVQVSDGFTIVLTHAGHRVTIEQGAVNVPTRLQRLMAAVATLFDAG